MRRAARAALLLVALGVTPALAQQPPAQKPQPRSPTFPTPAQQKPKVPREHRWFVALGGGIQATSSELSDQFTFDANAETGSTSVEYAAKAAPMLDVAVGRRFWKTGGFAAGFSYASTDGAAQIEADVPHPFFDDQDRHVSGEATGLGRTEMSTHVQVFWARGQRKWRTRVLGGLTYFNVRQDVVTQVNVTETYPYDTAEFRSVRTEEGSGSGIGFNAGVDVAWMQTPQFGWGGAVRYARGTVDLNVTEERNVSTDAGGVQAAVGVRISF